MTSPTTLVLAFLLAFVVAAPLSALVYFAPVLYRDVLLWLALRSLRAHGRLLKRDDWTLPDDADLMIRRVQEAANAFERVARARRKLEETERRLGIQP